MFIAVKFKKNKPGKLKQFFTSASDFEHTVYGYDVITLASAPQKRKKTLQKNLVRIYGTSCVKIVSETDIDDIKAFYASCKTRNLGHRRLKNTLTQLNQLLKYCKSQGLVSKCCSFQVKRLNEKNKFSMNRIIFED